MRYRRVPLAADCVGSLVIQFWVAGVPKAQPRPRKGKHGFYNPDNGVLIWKGAILWTFNATQRRYLACGPIRLTLSFVLKGGKTRVNGQPHASKPDFDNLEKAVCDALSGTAWRDDAQVFDCHTIKRYGEPTGVLITIEEVSA